MAAVRPAMPPPTIRTSLEITSPNVSSSATAIQPFPKQERLQAPRDYKADHRMQA
jgi:hypothetical protein